MKLSDVFSYLTYGELQQLRIGNMIPAEDESALQPKDYAKVLSHVNLGLKELYKRFLLATGECFVEQQVGTTIYELTWANAYTNPASTTKYVLDSATNPFVENEVNKIEQVFDPTGEAYYLNDRSEPLSLFTPSYRSIQVPSPVAGVVMSVHFRASHPDIPYTAGLDPEEIEVRIPDGLLEALLFYVAHRAYSTLNTEGGQEGADYWQKFEASCQKYAQLGLDVQAQLRGTVFDDRGWP